MTRRSTILAAPLAGAMIATAAMADAVVTFDDGLEGWVGPGGGTFIESDGGNPGANARIVFTDFGITFRTTTNADFVTDYTQWPQLRLSIDVKVNQVESFGQPTQRPWLIELRDRDDPPGGYPWVSVWYRLTAIQRNPEWITYAVTIMDTSAAPLPPGWGGTGAENEFGEPMLPPDRTFTDVLAGIDEVAFTTLEPGFFFIEAAFDLQLDNVTITSCPVDLDGDGAIGFGDILAILAKWGPCSSCPEDLNGDGVVDIVELLLVLGEWGACPQRGP